MDHNYDVDGYSDWVILSDYFFWKWTEQKFTCLKSFIKCVQLMDTAQPLVIATCRGTVLLGKLQLTHVYSSNIHFSNVIQPNTHNASHVRTWSCSPPSFCRWWSRLWFSSKSISRWRHALWQKLWWKYCCVQPLIYINNWIACGACSIIGWFDFYVPLLFCSSPACAVQFNHILVQRMHVTSRLFCNAADDSDNACAWGWRNVDAVRMRATIKIMEAR